MSDAQDKNQIGINVLNGEVIAHIPQNIIAQFGSVRDGQKLSAVVVNGEIVIKREP